MASSQFRPNLLLALAIAAAALFLFFWGCPYMAIFGHERLCIFFYALLLLVYVFGRASGPRPRRDIGRDAS